MGLVTFSSRVNEIFKMNEYSDRAAMMAIAEELEYDRGATNTGKALE